MSYDFMQFRYPWRPYQQRVLDVIDAHLVDQRLHIVAAPGAGKTTLGLEVFKRLGQPALILSPTRVIRDQWLQRLRDFCDFEAQSIPSWASNQLHEPRVLTSVTYQALHAKLSDELLAMEDEAEALSYDSGMNDGELHAFIARLRDHQIKVLILDEAHHLKAQWWRALDKICKDIPDLTLVSLTATPPYDAQSQEWQRYEALCGPIDEEISIPELVKAGTLCPHQDYIWAVDASQSEREKVRDFDQQVRKLCETLLAETEFEAIVCAHPWLQTAPNEAVQSAILKEPEIALSLLSFLQMKAIELPPALMLILDLEVQDIPALDRRWWQVLLHAVLFSRSFQHKDLHAVSVEQLSKQLRASELLYKRELSIERSRRLGRSLSLSSAKIIACASLHRLEHKYRGEALRQVILTDYIRDEQLNTGLDTGELNLGAWPIFRQLVATSPQREALGMLTGRISLIHTSRLQELKALLDGARIDVSPMSERAQYFRVKGPLDQLTAAFTALLMAGRINTLVGTRSLLGEGWDAPAVNSLVLASSVGSFMLTNQMRGRAIRIDKTAADKASSIWHLVAIDEKSDYAGWSDVVDLQARFETFVGLSEQSLSIESGFERMAAQALKPPILLPNSSPVAKNNRQMLRRYRQMHTLGKRWQQALALDEAARIMPSLRTPQVPQIRQYHLKNTLKYLLIQLGAGLMSALLFVLYSQAHSFRHLLLVFCLAFAGALIYALPKTIKALRILWKHLPPEGSLKQIGMALTQALCQAGMINTSFRRLSVSVSEGVDGSYFVALSGGSFYESSLFADALAEVLGPIESPRYLVVRAGKVFGMQRDDYHAVPMRFAVRKELAQVFYQSWCQYVGPTELIYTRSQTGRERLLKARMQAFSSNFKNHTKRQDRWFSEKP